MPPVTVVNKEADSILPVANNDNFNTNVNTPLNVAVPGVLGNDTHPPVLPLAAVLVSGPTNGLLTLNADGSFTYTPNANYFGADSFTYRATDGLFTSNVATVSLTVNALPPIATNDSFSTNVNTPLNVVASGVLGNDSDPQALSLQCCPGQRSDQRLTHVERQWFLQLHAERQLLRCRQFHLPGDRREVPLECRHGVSDCQWAAPCGHQRQFQHQRQHVAQRDRLGCVGQRQRPANFASYCYTRQWSQQRFPDPQRQWVFHVHTECQLLWLGQFHLPGQRRSGELECRHRALTVNALPPVATNDSFSTNLNTPLNVAAPGVLGNDSDPQTLALSAVLVSGPTNGSLTLNADGSFTYTPNANYFGADSFTYQATDGLFASNITSVSLTVSGLPPVAVNDSFSTNVNAPLNVTASGVLANDSDPQALSLSAVLVSGPTNGSLMLNADGSFSYTPNANYFGADSFTYQANDGLANSNVATVSLTINALPPVAVNDSFSTNVNTPLNVTASGVLANDSDPQTLALTEHPGEWPQQRRTDPQCQWFLHLHTER